jgi:pimeloyl-ACP methyl ester carboxylesterase/membrane protein DedA with SNARE-associated domain
MRAGKRSLALGLIAAYLALLAVSHGVRRLPPRHPDPQDGERIAELRPVPDAGESRDPVFVSYLDLAPGDDPRSPVVLLLHGTPGAKEHLEALGSALAQRFRVIVPDLPGFGSSSKEIPDYSIRAHAEYLTQLLGELRIERVHVVGFSFGGGVALELWDRDPAAIASVTLLSSTGVQELELFGDYRLNHVLHGLQLAGLAMVQEGVPHMGALDGVLDVAYARNVYDSDQRPLRGILERFEPPMLIIHGERDPLVPAAAAREHHRIVPHSELVMLDAGHFVPFTRAEEIAGTIGEFVERVERGAAASRADADSQRLAAAARPFDPSCRPPVTGLSLVILFLLIATATLVSEDLTCITVGVLVARGTIGFVPGTVACLVGIFAGDVLLYLAGRHVGRRVIALAPFRFLVRPRQLEAHAEWFERRGAIVVGVSRFLPGTRLATYLAAGILRARFLSFCLWLLAAAALWTPALVAVSAAVGTPTLALFERYGTRAGLAVGATAILVLIATRFAARAATHRGRRLLLSRWRRLRRWEFWPRWVFYPPVVAYLVYLGVRFRGPLLFTAANPAIPSGGFVGESKAAILEALVAIGAPVARFARIPSLWDGERRIAETRRFMAGAGLSLPVVVKPDVGQRGEGVVVARDAETLERVLRDARRDLLVQEHVPGRELGVFYVRHPDQERGRIFSITDKRMPVVVGDGRRTLARLILDDDRAVCMARTHLDAHAERLDDVPADGEPVPLVDVGTHCRGALFLDGAALATPEFTRSIDEISRRYEGFYFGRYDLRGSGLDPASGGGRFKIIELNGVTSESTDIYDPSNRLVDAYRKIFRQWRIAFEIGATNRAAGARPLGLGAFSALVLDYFRMES